jgi:hypothetical protein
LVTVAVVGVIGLTAAFLTGTRRVRRPNPPAAMGDVRTVMSAQNAYKELKVDGGWYAADLRCLVSPTSCSAGYPAQAPTFLDASFADPELTRWGYRRRFASARQDLALPPKAADSYAYLVVPLEGADAPSFCGDASGQILRSGQSAPTVSIENGRCVGGMPLH